MIRSNTYLLKNKKKRGKKIGREVKRKAQRREERIKLNRKKHICQRDHTTWLYTASHTYARILNKGMTTCVPLHGLSFSPDASQWPQKQEQRHRR